MAFTYDANVYNTSIRRGDCWTLVVTWKPDDEFVSMTGYTSQFVVEWPRQTNGNGIVSAGEVTVVPVIDTAAHTVTVDMSAAVTLTIPNVNRAVYQLRLTDTDGCKITIATGVVTVQPDYIDA